MFDEGFLVVFFFSLISFTSIAWGGGVINRLKPLLGDRSRHGQTQIPDDERNSGCELSSVCVCEWLRDRWMMRGSEGVDGARTDAEKCNCRLGQIHTRTHVLKELKHYLTHTHTQGGVVFIEAYKSFKAGFNNGPLS